MSLSQTSRTRWSGASKKISGSEEIEQRALIEWAQLNERKWPQLKLLHHIPNGGARSKATAGRLKAMGVKPGVCDLFLPVRNAAYPGLYIEMKWGRGRLQDTQAEFITAVREQGFMVAVCHSWTTAVKVIEAYLSAV